MGQRRGLKISFLGIKNQNLKTHVTKEKKLGGRKGQLFQELWFFLFRQATLIDSKE